MSQTPRRILVPTDLEPTTDRALAFGAYLASRFAAELHLLHVRVLLADAHLEEEHQAQITRLLAEGDGRAGEALQGGPLAAPGVTVSRHMVRGVSASEAIVQTCSDLACDLVVMGTHGRRGVRHLLLGSVAEEVVRTADAPVLTVRPGSDGESLAVTRILVPHDLSPHSLEAVRLAAAWARSLDASVTLLHAVEPIVFPQLYGVDPLPQDIFGRVRERTQEQLGAVASEQLAGVACEVVVAAGVAAETIVRETEERHADLVVMGSRGLSGLEHLLLGSVTERVLRRSPAPLLVVRGPRE